jgi:hypothetical protein
MVMIFVVILIAAVTTIIAASVDLGRMAGYKQKQSEREAKWQYCVESGEAFVTEDLVALADTNQNFFKTVNGINLTVAAAPDLSWNYLTSTKVSVTAILDGKTRTTNSYLGKRSTVNPCEFGMYFTNVFSPNSSITIAGDAFLEGSIDASQLSITGDIYSPSATAPTVASQTGSFIGHQSGQTIQLDDATYSSAASITTSGATTLSNPTNASLGLRSQLRYHTGDLTIKGTVTGEITIYVSGSVNLSPITNAPGGFSRLVVICNGDVLLNIGTINAFVIASGRIRSSLKIGTRNVTGSLAATELSGTNQDYIVSFDDYFSTTPFSGYRYWIPGQ